MKTKNFETSLDVFAVFALTNEEMITVRGGEDGNPSGGTVTPPIKV